MNTCQSLRRAADGVSLHNETSRNCTGRPNCRYHVGVKIIAGGLPFKVSFTSQSSFTLCYATESVLNKDSLTRQARRHTNGPMRRCELACKRRKRANGSICTLRLVVLPIFTQKSSSSFSFFFFPPNLSLSVRPHVGVFFTNEEYILARDVLDPFCHMWGRPGS